VFFEVFDEEFSKVLEHHLIRLSGFAASNVKQSFVSLNKFIQTPVAWSLVAFVPIAVLAGQDKVPHAIF